MAFLGAGDDTFVWNPGDGSDTVEGQDGFDTMLFNGANINEKIDVSANGGRVRFTRDVANITMDLNGVEGIDFNALGGADQITVNDLSGTDVTQVNLNLESSPGSGTGDGAADTVIVNGTNGNDSIDVLGAGSSYAVIGLPAVVSVSGSEGANDRLVVSALGGNDTISAATLPATTVLLTVDGGTGNDRILGGAGDDTLLGGDGNDFIDGNRGNDVAFLGAGDDVFQWDPGDGSDIVEGQDGFDTMLFNGANIAEKIDISANGGRVRFTRDVANITMDLNGVERINFNALGGADQITVNDLSGTDVTQVNLEPRRDTGQSGDGAADSVIVNGTAGADAITVRGNSAQAVNVTGLAASVFIVGSEPALDSLTINSLAGDDIVERERICRQARSHSRLNGGDGTDILIGSQGDDLVNGGRGDDMALARRRRRHLRLEPGRRQRHRSRARAGSTPCSSTAPTSTRRSTSPPTAAASASPATSPASPWTSTASRGSTSTPAAAPTRSPSTTSPARTSPRSTSTSRAPRAAAPATAQPIPSSSTAPTGMTSFRLSGDASGVAVTGLAALVNITGAEAANDRLILDGADGDDVIVASGLAAGAIQLTENGGNGNDELLGGSGDDTLLGEAGDDVLSAGRVRTSWTGGPAITS